MAVRATAGAAISCCHVVLPCYPLCHRAAVLLYSCVASSAPRLPYILKWIVCNEILVSRVSGAV